MKSGNVFLFVVGNALDTRSLLLYPDLPGDSLLPGSGTCSLPCPFRPREPLLLTPGCCTVLVVSLYASLHDCEESL